MIISPMEVAEVLKYILVSTCSYTKKASSARHCDWEAQPSCFHCP